jgi:hypothetical protein
MDHERYIQADLHNKEISRADAITRLVDLRYTYVDAQAVVDEWIEDWEAQEDHREEQEQGWT